MPKSSNQIADSLFQRFSSKLPILQAFRFADTARDHIARLLGWADFPTDANIVDLGSGSGSVAAQMNDLRPDLSFCMVDNSRVQLDLSGSQFRKHCADICAVPEPDSSFEAAICCYAIGYVDADLLFREIYRLLKPGGIAFIADMVPLARDVDHQSLFGYAIRSGPVLRTSAEAAGLALDFYLEPADHSGWGESQFPGYFKILFGDLKPAIWRFRRLKSPGVSPTKQARS